MLMTSETNDLLVFSHLRWDYAFQRTHQIFGRHAKFRRVYYVEEAVFGLTAEPRLHLRETTEGVQIVVPHLPSEINSDEIPGALRDLLDELIFDEGIMNFTSWYDSADFLSFTDHLKATQIIYDRTRDQDDRILLEKAHLVYVDDHQVGLEFHSNAHALPSSIDYAHFAKARCKYADPEDQAAIPHPRIGFAGVLDHNFNFELLKSMAEARHDYQFVLVGSVIGIDQDSLPKASNIHYLGHKNHQEVIEYMSGWDAFMLPLHYGKTSRFNCLMRVPELLATGKPIVSTPMMGLVEKFHQAGLLSFAHNAEAFMDACDKVLEEISEDSQWLSRVDGYLALTSWDKTFERMAQLESDYISTKPFSSSIEEKFRFVVPTDLTMNAIVS